MLALRLKCFPLCIVELDILSPDRIMPQYQACRGVSWGELRGSEGCSFDQELSVFWYVYTLSAPIALRWPPIQPLFPQRPAARLCV
jgi:hypothetical protein